MKLTKDEKEALKAIKNHHWYKVLEKIHEEAIKNLWISILTNSDLDNPQDITIIKRNKDFIQARSDFFRDTEKHLREIYSNETV